MESNDSVVDGFVSFHVINEFVVRPEATNELLPNVGLSVGTVTVSTGFPISRDMTSAICGFVRSSAPTSCTTCGSLLGLRSSVAATSAISCVQTSGNVTSSRKYHTIFPYRAMLSVHAMMFSMKYPPRRLGNANIGKLVQDQLMVVEADEMAGPFLHVAAKAAEVHGVLDRRLVKRVEEACRNRRIVSVRIVPIGLDHGEGSFGIAKKIA